MHADASGMVHLPVGFERFHRQQFLNYQLNRAHALGFVGASELREAANRIRTHADSIPVFEEFADRTERQGRLPAAAGFLRLAEFFTPPSSLEKPKRYRRFRALFDRTAGDAGVIRHAVPYGASALPVYRMAAIDHASVGCVLLHGGFDSVIEEFYAIWQRLAAAGFDVIAFDGPGQGGARILNGMTFAHDWEKPVAAVLDHFQLETAALIGISMGGHWALRAAAHEPRIDRVVSWPPVYDWVLRVPGFARAPVRAMLNRRDFMRWSIRLRARLFPVLRFVVDHVLYIIDSEDPADVVDWFLAMNPSHLGSERITQDVLLLVGEHDSFQPPAFATAQASALTAARSVTTRTFTAAEQADQHCQMGNLELACRVLTAWLRDPTSPVAACK